MIAKTTASKKAAVKPKAAVKSGAFFDRIKPPAPKSMKDRRRHPREETTEGQSPRKVRGRSASKFEKNLVFVGMSFRGDGMDEAFIAIRETCKSLKLNARRVDENMSSGFIILEIVDLIERAEFIVFDLSFERPNVYYELGFAHGVGNSPSNILLTAREGTDLHFDIAALRVRFYKSTEELRRIVKENLAAMIKTERNQ